MPAGWWITKQESFKDISKSGPSHFALIDVFEKIQVEHGFLFELICYIVYQ